MKATEILMEEHRVIERVLASLEEAVRRLNSGQAVRPGFFILASDFIKGFADGCHHRKEEGVLFKALDESGLPAENSPVSVMLSEHDAARRLTRNMRAAAERWQAGDESARAAVIENALAYTALLRGHIQKEDQILFPLAGRMIPLKRQDEVWEGFETVEHEETGEGVHEKYLAVADALERELS